MALSSRCLDVRSQTGSHTFSTLTTTPLSDVALVEWLGKAFYPQIHRFLPQVLLRRLRGTLLAMYF